MDPLLAVRIRKPRRTNSTPGNVHRAAFNRTLPAALGIALFGGRDAKHHPRAPEWRPASSSSKRADESVGVKEDDARPTLCVDALCEASTSSGVAAPVAPVTPTLHEDDMNEILAQMNEAGGPDDDDDESLMTKEDVTTSTAAPETTEEEEFEFDVDETRYWLNKLRGVTGYCSDKIAYFAQDLWDSTGEAETGRLLLGRDGMAAPVQVQRKRRLFGEKEPELHQRVLGVLNKVTDDQSKYREIRNELMRLPLPEADPASLDFVVKCFFKKAVMEQRFSSHYANLVEEICKIPPGQIQTGDVKDSLSYRLRVQLLCQCQHEFSNHRSLSSLPRVDPESGRQLSSEELEAMRMHEKKKLCGNVKFVGELYLRKIVSSKIIQLIVLKLLFGTDNPAVLDTPSYPTFVPEENECDQLITLLMTTGAVFFFSTSVGQHTLPAVRFVVNHFSQHHPVNRTRYLLMDLLEAINRKFEKKNSVQAKAAIAMQQHQQQQQQQHPAVAAQSHPHPSAATGRPQPPLAVSTTPVHPHSMAAPPTTIARKGFDFRVDPAATSHQQPQQNFSPQPAHAPQRDTPPPQTPPPYNGKTPQSNPSSPITVSSGSTSATPTPLSVKTILQPPGKSTLVGIPQPRSAQSPLSKTPGSMMQAVPAAQVSPAPVATTPLASQQQQQPPRQTPPAMSGPLPGPSSHSPKQTFPAATAENITPLVAKFTSSHDHLGVALELATTFSNACQALQLFIQRFLSVVKAEPERLKIALILSALTEHGIARDALRDITQTALMMCVSSGLHEGGYKLWKFWTQIIAGDVSGTILDDSLLNIAFSEVLRKVDDVKDVARNFIIDVITVRNAMPMRASQVSDASRYNRFAPLSVLMQYGKATAPQDTNFVIDIVNHPSVAKLKDIEITTFVSLLKGKPPKTELIQRYTSDENLMKDYFAPAKVLSALYHAEHCVHGQSYLDENMDLLLFVIDYSEREVREMATIVELYHCTKWNEGERTNEGQRWFNKLRLHQIVTDETHELAHRRLGHDAEIDLRIGANISRSADLPTSLVRAPPLRALH